MLTPDNGNTVVVSLNVTGILGYFTVSGNVNETLKEEYVLLQLWLGSSVEKDS